MKSFVAWGGRLVVHPRAFTVHVPHSRSAAYNSAFRPQSQADVQRRAQARSVPGGGVQVLSIRLLGWMAPCTLFQGV